MSTITGIIILIDRIKIARKNKQLPDAERIDLIMLPENRTQPCRFQIRREKSYLVKEFRPGDIAEVTFCCELNEIKRNGLVQRFDNNILEDLKKLNQ